MARILSACLLVVCIVLGFTPVHAQNPPPANDSGTESGFAEELIDLMLMHCQAGDQAQANAIGQAIREQLDPPPFIIQLLDQINPNGCQSPAAQRAEPHTEVTLAIGYDDNSNQGIGISSITLGNSLQPITFQLDGSYRPIASSHLTATATRQTQTASGWRLHATAGLRHLNQYSTLDTIGLHLGARQTLKPLGIPSSVQLGWSESWMGGSRYQQAPYIEWQSKLGANATNTAAPDSWQINGLIQRFSHPGLSTQNAISTRLGISRQYRPTPSSRLTLGAALVHDQALNQRAGGNRQGQQLNANVQHFLGQAQLQAQWSQTRWDSAQAFSPGLIDQTRSNQTTQLSLGYHRPQGHGVRLYIEYQHRSAHDNIPLYTYRSNALVAGWSQQWR
jgi:hypothetical protein